MGDFYRPLYLRDERYHVDADKILSDNSSSPDRRQSTVSSDGDTVNTVDQGQSTHNHYTSLFVISCSEVKIVHFYGLVSITHKK